MMDQDMAHYIGIDPGREKFGLALRTEGAIVFSAIVPLEQLDRTASCIKAGDLAPIAPSTLEGSAPDAVIIKKIFIGDGTGSSLFYKVFDRTKLLYTVVSERDSTLEARSLYWRLHPPRGIARIVPISLRIPPRPIDDLAAAVIALRGISQEKNI